MKIQREAELAELAGLERRVRELEAALLPFADYARALQLDLGDRYRTPILRVAGIRAIGEDDWKRAVNAFLPQIARSARLEPSPFCE